MLTKEQKKALQTQGLNNLMIACLAGDLNEVKRQVTIDNINQFTPERNYTPLVYAFKANNKEVVTFLLNNGANITIGCPLLALEGIRDEITQQEINDYPNCHYDILQPSEVAVWTPLVWSPLMFAAKYCDQPIIDLLLDRGADLMAEGEHYIIPIHDVYAWQVPFLYNKISLGNYLITRNRHRIKQEDIDALVIKCILLKQYDSIIFLSSNYQADINFDLNALYGYVEEDDEKMDLGLCQAVKKEDEYDPLLFDIMFRHGAKVNDEDQSDRVSVLAWASKHGYIDMVNRLLAHSDININAPYIGDSVANPNDYPYIRTALMHASKYGQMDVVNRLIAHGASINLTDDNNETALMKACKAGHRDIALVLLDNGANIGLQDNKGQTALMYASQYGHADMIPDLINRGASIDQIDNNNKTALIKACKAGYRESARVLLRHNANINMQDNEGKTPLMHATANSRTDVVEVLLENKASLTLRDHQGNHALMLACQHGYANIVDQFFSCDNHGNIAILCNTQDKTPLMIAAEYGQLECLDRLLSVLLTHTLNNKDKDGHTALMLACKNNHINIVERLINCGADIHIINLDGYLAIDLALRNNNDHIKELFITFFKLNESIINEKNNFLARRMNPLMIACMQNDIAHVEKILAETNIDVNSFTNGLNYPPLIYACIRNNIELLSLLVNRGAQVNIKYTFISSKNERELIRNIAYKTDDFTNGRADNWTPIMFASLFNDDHIFKYLCESGANSNDKATHLRKIIGDFSAWELPYYYNRPHAGNYLSCQGADSSNATKPIAIYNKLLSRCIYLKQEKSIICLVKNFKADINNPLSNRVDMVDMVDMVDIDDSEGVHPLFYAIDTKDAKFFQLLMVLGADINHYQDLDYPLTKAAECGHLEIVKLLLDKKALLTNFKEQMSEAFLRACQYGHADIIKLLICEGHASGLGDIGILRHDYNQTGFMMSCKYGQTAIVTKFLNSYPLDLVNLANADGETAFMMACQYGRVDTVQLLLQLNCIDINQVDRYGNTALMKACANGQNNNAPEKNNDDRYAHVVATLLAAGANINAINTDGNTALMIACQRKGRKIVSNLLNNPSINLTIKNKNNQTAEMLANNKIKELFPSHISSQLSNHQNLSFFQQATSQSAIANNSQSNQYKTTK